VFTGVFINTWLVLKEFEKYQQSPTKLQIDSRIEVTELKLDKTEAIFGAMFAAVFPALDSRAEIIYDFSACERRLHI